MRRTSRTYVKSRLTKREHFAALMMQGLFAWDWDSKDDVAMAREAVRLADVLMDTLNLTTKVGKK